MTTATRIKAIRLHEDEDYEAVMNSEFGSSHFLSKTKPTSAALKDRVVGELAKLLPLEPGQKRRKLERRWVVAKPPKQTEEPTVRRTISLPESLAAKMDNWVEANGSYFSTEVCRAIAAFLQP